MSEIIGTTINGSLDPYNLTNQFMQIKSGVLTECSACSVQCINKFSEVCQDFRLSVKDTLDHRHFMALTFIAFVLLARSLEPFYVKYVPEKYKKLYDVIMRNLDSAMFIAVLFEICFLFFF